MKRVESEAGRECEEKETGDSYCTDGPTGPEGGEVSSEGTNEERGEGEEDRGLVDGGREVENERSDSTTHEAANVPLEPLSEKEDVDAYITQFERIATMNGWNRAGWASKLVSLVRGRPRDALMKKCVNTTS
ncbi:hypothetical protein ACOMHN_060852 [Nucella lapillus]